MALVCTACVKCGDIASSNRALVALPSTASLDAALSLMYTHDVLSLPVYAASADPAKLSKESFTGVVDMIDIVAYVVYGYFKPASDGKFTEEDFSGKKLFELTVADVIGVERQLSTGFWDSGLTFLDGTKTLFDGLDTFITGQRRALLEILSMDEDRGEVSSEFKCLSQMDIIKYLAAQGESGMGLVGKMSLEEAGLLVADKFNELCVAPEDATVLSAYRKMITSKADAVAVIDEAGKLVSTLSPADFRFLWSKEKSLKNLMLPVGKYLQLIRDDKPTPIVLKPKDTVSMAIFTASNQKLRRVWVTDDSNVPVACVRLQDLLVKFSGADHKKYLSS